MTNCYASCKTPVGCYLLQARVNQTVANGQLTLFKANWVQNDWEAPAAWTAHHPMLAETAKMIQAYLLEKDIDPALAPLPTPAGPKFHQSCWEALRTVGRGQCITYGQLAVLAGGHHNQARAVGAAMRSNPLPLIVPCHRVLAQDGTKHRLGGYMGAHKNNSRDGRPLQIKRWLLRLEGTLDPKDISMEKRACA